MLPDKIAASYIFYQFLSTTTTFVENKYLFHKVKNVKFDVSLREYDFLFSDEKSCNFSAFTPKMLTPFTCFSCLNLCLSSFFNFLNLNCLAIKFLYTIISKLLILSLLKFSSNVEIHLLIATLKNVVTVIIIEISSPHENIFFVTMIWQLFIIINYFVFATKLFE